MPTSTVRDDVERWTRVFNRRRLAERLLRTAVFLGIAAVLAVGLQRLVLALMVLDPSAVWLPDPQSLVLWVWSLYAAGAIIGIVYTSVRAWQQRIDVMTLARRLDREHQTHDVLATAIALDRGDIEAPADLATMVQTRARSCSADLRDPVPPFTAPSRALATAGAVAAAVALLPASAESLVDLAVRTASAAPAEHSSEIADPTLSPESLERLERSADALADLERRPALHDSARDRLRSAREQLHALGNDPSRSLARLSRAEQSLRDLQRQSADEGLYDPEELRALGQDELAETMTEAIERREDDTAAAMADEMARRVQDADANELASMASSLERALGKTSPADASDPSSEAAADPARRQRGGDQAKASEDASADSESGRSDDPRQRWRKATEGLPDQMRAGEGDAARDTLRKMAEEMAGSSARPSDGRQSADGVMERALDDIRRARSEQLAEMNRESGSGDGRSESPSSDGSSKRSEADGSRGRPGEGNDESEGQPGGAGIPFGMPGGRPGPGGGVGSDALGDPKDAPLMSLHGADRVEARPDGTTQGSVAVIQRFTEGHRDDREYEDLHHEYESVAESAIRREQIPLTRRDYIRNYFQAVRPQ